MGEHDCLPVQIFGMYQREQVQVFLKEQLYFLSVIVVVAGSLAEVAEVMEVVIAKQQNGLRMLLGKLIISSKFCSDSEGLIPS